MRIGLAVWRASALAAFAFALSTMIAAADSATGSGKGGLSLLAQPALTDAWLDARAGRRIDPDFPLEWSRFHFGFVEGNADWQAALDLEALLRLDFSGNGICYTLSSAGSPPAQQLSAPERALARDLGAKVGALVLLELIVKGAKARGANRGL